VVEQGVQRWAVEGFWLQWVQPRASQCRAGDGLLHRNGQHAPPAPRSTGRCRAARSACGAHESARLGRSSAPIPNEDLEAGEGSSPATVMLPLQRNTEATPCVRTCSSCLCKEPEESRGLGISAASDLENYDEVASQRARRIATARGRCRDACAALLVRPQARCAPPDPDILACRRGGQCALRLNPTRIGRWTLKHHQQTLAHIF